MLKKILKFYAPVISSVGNLLLLALPIFDPRRLCPVVVLAGNIPLARA